MPSLDWIGKSAVIKHHKQVPFHLLKHVPALSVGDPDSENLIIEGDNLEVLKALLPYYAGQVKCIYIDPPYNTGNENWIYNDNVNSPKIREWLGKAVGSEGEDLSRHDKWLCMMYPRLQVMKDFLRNDGVIIISIDDFEVFNLRHLLNEVFGPANFIAQLVWEKTRKNDAKLFSTGHEYLLVYARSLATLRSQKIRWRESKPGADEIMAQFYTLKTTHSENWIQIETDLQSWYKSLPKAHPSKKLSRYKHIDGMGVWRDRDISWPGGGGPRYDVIHPVTGLPCKVPERGWGFATSEAMQDQIAKGLVIFRKDHTEPPFRKAYLFPLPEELIEEPVGDEGEEEVEEELVGAQVMPSVIYKQAQVAVKLLRNIFDGKKVFPNPKDHEVLMRLIKYVTGPDDLILDAFAGSASTGHAVLELNKINGNRKFILIEMDKSIFADVTIQRLRRVITGYSYGPSTKRKSVDGLGGGFRASKLGETIFNAEGRIREEVTFDELARHVFFVETGIPLPKRANGKTPLLGTHNGAAVYLLYNGILKDKTPNGGNVLTRSVLALLPAHTGPKVIYGTSCRIDEQNLRQWNIIFRQIPYAIKTE